jgi:hypothetical protein
VRLHFPHYRDEEEGRMNQWHDFFLAQAAATATLTGLVFVGVSINLRKILSDPRSGLAGRAAESLILLVAVLTVSVLVLVPGQGAGLPGAEVLVVGLAAWGWIVAIQLPRLRDWRVMRADLRVPLVLRVVLGQVATLTLVIAGVAVFWVGRGGLYWLVAGTVFSILAALADAWVLLVEINR